MCVSEDEIHGFQNMLGQIWKACRLNLCVYMYIVKPLIVYTHLEKHLGTSHRSWIIDFLTAKKPNHHHQYQGKNNLQFNFIILLLCDYLSLFYLNIQPNFCNIAVYI